MIYCFTFFGNQGINEFNKNSTYVKNNEVTEIFDNKQRLSVKLEYNKNRQETVRKFGNGTKEETLYDKAGRVTVKAQKSERNELLWAEGYVYGDDGKRTATVDNKGRVTLYEYNKKGQLETVYYPYSQEMINLLKSEAEENGLPTNTDISENKYLPADIKSGLSSLLNSMQYGLAYSLPNMQIFVKESYSYDKNGNRTGRTTKYGTINYSYDRENRLVSSGSRGQAFVNYTYDSMGNLLTEESSFKSTKYAYNAQNRLIYCEVTDKAEKTYAQTTYAYDAFGRRVIVQDKGEAAVRTLYDGFTFDVIKQSSTLANGLFTDSNNTGIRWSPTGKPTGDRYRYISDEDAQDDNRYFYLDENIYKTVNSRYRDERTQISVNGSLAAQASSEGEQYFTTDLSGSVSSVTDSYGYQLGEYTYDAFGSLVQGDLSGVTDFGYLGKQNDPTSKLYNYGYRDYKPEAARFTTVDPIRDGTNWFVYCNSDSVNFVDLWGLKANDTRKKVEFGKDIYSEDYIKRNVPKQYQAAAIKALKEEEKKGLYGSPTDSKRITEVTGVKTELQDIHTGVDIGALKRDENGKSIKGDPIYATADGTVFRNGKTNSGSTRVELTLPYTKNTAIYQHADFIVKEGDQVKRGQIIGYMSDNGTSGSVHLHYEIRKNGEYAGEDKAKIEDPLIHMPATYRKE